MDTESAASAAGILHDAVALAGSLAEQAAAIARAAMRDGVRTHAIKDEHGDVITGADHAAERLIVDGITERFPDHRIETEEAGALGASDSAWTWLVDPLDGTNNVVLGLPLFGVCIALRHHREIVAGVIYDGSSSRMFSAVCGRGARLEGEPVHLAPPPVARQMTISWIQGYGVSRTDRFARDAPAALAREHKRLLVTWSPSVDWSRVATGNVAALVAYKNEGEDLHAGLLLVAEAGGMICDLDGHPVEDPATLETIIAGHPAGVAAVRHTLAASGCRPCRDNHRKTRVT